ncbi:MAG: PD40 domain-containing protein, partial [Planctomycetes bacterium]|nr:PD40 domain-containing protein [Planctomycetota bacterium]
MSNLRKGRFALIITAALAAAILGGPARPGPSAAATTRPSVPGEPASRRRVAGDGHNASKKRKPQAAVPPSRRPQPRYKSPTCIAFSPDGRTAYVTNNTAGTVSIIDAEKMKVAGEVRVGSRPTGIAVGPGGKVVFAAVTGDHVVAFMDPRARKVAARLACGYEPTGLAVSPDGRRLYAANFISGDVAVIDVAARRLLRRIPVGRAPTYLAITPDGKRLLVNHLLAGEPATDPNLSTTITVIDTAAGKVVAQKLSPGTMLLGQGIAVSPNGELAFAVHSRPNFNVTPAQLNQGWVHTNALTMIARSAFDKPGRAGVRTFLLDNVSSGAANPYGVAVSKDGRRVFVSHRGIHQVSIVDLDALRRLIARSSPTGLAAAHVNLGFLWGPPPVVRRVDCGGLGPEGLAVNPADGSVWVALRFSGAVGVLDGHTGRLLKRIDLGGPAEPRQWTVVRRGEFLFHDAGHCFQHWV